MTKRKVFLAMLKFVVYAGIGAVIYAYITGDITNSDVMMAASMTMDVVDKTVELGSMGVDAVSNMMESDNSTK